MIKKIYRFFFSPKTSWNLDESFQNQFSWSDFKLRIVSISIAGQQHFKIQNKTTTKMQ